ncbi:cupin domain-containing protein, partial [Streptomyces sp. Wh19]|uniref:cupin domain-containing protein n=1 Tax=Streptomyces sp. Wh19 TaxID=3076629 RepID=UPI00295CBA7F|nr:cupin [Streptomyces sp. Wh19]
MPTFEGLPGAVAVSHLRVYDWPTADGLRGGTPHLHLTCSEGYVVVGGTGSVQTLTASGFRQTALAPGALVWFTPGTIHRLVNEDGLRIVVLMENSGLPEAGDAVLTLPPDRLADPEVYRASVALP